MKNGKKIVKDTEFDKNTKQQFRIYEKSKIAILFLENSRADTPDCGGIR